MAIIKRLHIFMLKTFLPLFAMTFCIVLFIVLMQFLWKYIDDLVGKGLSFGVLAELFFYAAVSMVPMALPLAVLLASLMTFGNLGEKFELTAMKASGISLVRVMAPLIITVAAIAVGAFFFQNDILPKAQVKMWTLLFSVRQKSPELEIPESVFYDQIPGYNLYVKEKNRESGMLHDVKIYDVTKGGDNATILTADSARLALTPDMKHLFLHLWHGEQFENLRDQSAGAAANIPFRREVYDDKQILIPFDANFNRLDEEGMRKQYVGKNIAQLRSTMDSVAARLDSIGAVYGGMLQESELPLLNREAMGAAHRVDYSATASEAPRDDDFTVSSGSSNSSVKQLAGKSSNQPERKAKDNSVFANAKPFDVKNTLKGLPPQQGMEIIDNALSISERRREMMSFRAQMIDDEKKTFRRHEIELIKKFTLSVACIIFFFIGAPLGAIIRKGGIGTPLVISVFLFLFYYIIDNTGYKMARDGRIIVWAGMWLSTFILAPLGVFVTYKAMNDSAVFDRDRYVAFFNRLLGRKTKRHYVPKEVIIKEVDGSVIAGTIDGLLAEAKGLLATMQEKCGFIRYWKNGVVHPEMVQTLASNTEDALEYIHDSHDTRLVLKLGTLPVLRQLWVYRPVHGKWTAWVAIVLAPLTFPVYLAGLTGRKLLKSDLEKTVQILEECTGVSAGAFGPQSVDTAL